ELFEPLVVILMQSAFIVVDEHRCCDVHGVHQRQPFLDTALAQALLHLRRNVDESPPRRHFEPKLLAITLHCLMSSRAANRGSSLFMSSPAAHRGSSLFMSSLAANRGSSLFMSSPAANRGSSLSIGGRRTTPSPAP